MKAGLESPGPVGVFGVFFFKTPHKILCFEKRVVYPKRPFRMDSFSAKKTLGDWTAHLSALAWWTGNNEGSTPYNAAYNPEGFPAGRKVVGLRAANGAGLYDMHGNVSEWCNDWYATYQNLYGFMPRSAVNPTGAVSGSSRTTRGGGYNDTAMSVHSANRSIGSPVYGSASIGLRLSAVVP